MHFILRFRREALLSTVLMLMMVCLQASCVAPPSKWGYVPIPVSVASSFPVGSTLAVAYPEEGRKNITDEDQLELSRKGGGFIKAPDRLVFGRALYQQLSSIQQSSVIPAFSIVHWDPTFTEDYDFTLHSRILGPLQGVHLPEERGKCPPCFVVDLWLTTPQGERLGYQRVQLDEEFPKLQSGISKSLSGILSTIEIHLTTVGGTDPKKRARKYYEALDPELRVFRENLTSRTASSTASARTMNSLARAYILKTAVLESLRLTEEEANSKGQALRHEYVDKCLQNIFEANGRIASEMNRRTALSLISAGIAGFASVAATDPRLSSDPNFAMTMSNISLSAQAVSLQAQDPAMAQTFQASITDAVAAQDQKVLSLFQNIQGTSREVREQWIKKYRDNTPSLEAIQSGRWPVNEQR